MRHNALRIPKACNLAVQIESICMVKAEREIKGESLRYMAIRVILQAELRQVVLGLFAASRQACARRSRLRRANRVVLGKMARRKIEEQVKTMK